MRRLRNPCLRPFGAHSQAVGDGRFTPTQDGGKDFQGLLTNGMLHAAGILMGDLRCHAELHERGGHDTPPMAYRSRQFHALRREEDAAIRPRAGEVPSPETRDALDGGHM